MKVNKHILLTDKSISEFAAGHLDEHFKFFSVSGNVIDIVQETDQTEAEMHMEHLRTLIDCDDYLTDEEKAAIEYAIECIKTLDDMGIIKENKDND